MFEGIGNLGRRDLEASTLVQSYCTFLLFVLTLVVASFVDILKKRYCCYAIHCRGIEKEPE